MLKTYMCTYASKEGPITASSPEEAAKRAFVIFNALTMDKISVHENVAKPGEPEDWKSVI